MDYVAKNAASAPLASSLEFLPKRLVGDRGSGCGRGDDSCGCSSGGGGGLGDLGLSLRRGLGLENQKRVFDMESIETR